MRPIVIHPEIPLAIDKSLVRSALPDVEIREPEPGSVRTALGDMPRPLAFICSSSVWGDSYLDALSEDDWVTTIGAGYDAYPVDQFDQRGVRFTNTPGIHGEAVGEHVFGMAFAFSRCLLAYRDHQREHDWAKRAEPVTDYAGEVCCVVGLGRIGEAVAERARVFDMLVRGVKRRTEGYQGAAQEVYPADDLHHALNDAMLVVVCVPLTDRTRGLLGDPELSVLADGAVIVNVSRGAVIETAALLAALDDGCVRGAGLDVFTEEPLPENAPFWDRDDVLVTPHRAAASDKYPQRFLETFQEQYTSLTETGRLEHQLTTRSDESSG